VTPEEAAKIANCAECPFAKDGLPPHKPVLAEVNTNKPIAILVGEHPGENEVRENRPFVGATGKELDTQLAKASIPRHQTVVLNAIACRPGTGKTDQILGRAAKCCKPLFDKQFVAANEGRRLPTLAMGKWAGYAVTGTAKATETGRGFIRENNLLLTYHPTYAFFRNPWSRGDFIIDLDRFRRLIEGKLQADPVVVTAPTMSACHDLLKAIARNNNVVAVDIETGAEDGDADGHTGKDPTRARLKTIAFGTPDYALAFEWPIYNGMRTIISALLIDPLVTKVFHNGYFFDLRVLKRYGIEVVNITDTREIRRALVATSGLSLRYLAQTYVDYKPWKELEDDK
jgi:DNA polymerase